MIEQIYRRLIIPGFESVVKRRKTFRFWKELEESQWWSREQLEALQLRRLRKHIDHCFKNCPFYRQLWTALGLSPRVLQSVDDFHRWPVISRAMMRDHADRIRSTSNDVKAFAKSTGGSSGAPLQFAVDRRANERRMAAAYRGYAWAGAPPGTRQTYFWAASAGSRTPLFAWKEHLYSRYLYRRDVLNSFEMSDESVPTFVDRIARFRPDVLVGYTNPLYLFARSIEECGLRPYRPQAIIVGAEKLHDFQRELIERVFAAPVFETYGSREFTLIGAECEKHAGLHLTMENLLVEVVDEAGYPTPAGEEGNVVITDFFNVAVPFVRYEIGDRVIAGFESCSCGRGLPLLKKVVGRQVDTLVTANGRRLPGEFFPHLIKEHAPIRQFQVVQHQRDVVELKLVVDRHWEREAQESLRREVQDAVGDTTRLLINEVDAIPLTTAGKLRVVVGYASPSEDKGQLVLEKAAGG